MSIEELISEIFSLYPGLQINTNWGERGLFYNPENNLPLGAYMLTFKERDGKNDSSSRIDKKEGIYRLNLKIQKPTFTALFGSVPKRPTKGSIVDTGHDFTKLDEIMPHPVYGWMTWICVLNPSKETIKEMQKAGLFEEAYSAAVATFNKKIAKQTQT